MGIRNLERLFSVSLHWFRHWFGLLMFKISFLKSMILSTTPFPIF